MSGFFDGSHDSKKKVKSGRNDELQICLGVCHLAKYGMVVYLKPFFPNIYIALFYCDLLRFSREGLTDEFDR